MVSSRPSVEAIARASALGSVTTWGSAYTAFAGRDIASSWPLRSKIVPRSAGIVIRWMR